jgi:sugar phosphate isomerase/epimerase
MLNRLTSNRQDFLRGTAGIIAGAAIAGNPRPATAAIEGFCKIGDGDVDWPAVRIALGEIEFSGWCTAEVEGGGRQERADISQRMDRVLTG